MRHTDLKIVVNVKEEKKKLNDFIELILLNIFPVIGVIVLGLVIKFANFIGITFFALFIVFVIGLAIFGITYIIGKRKRKRTRIFGIVIGYLNIIFLFSIVYFLIYNTKPTQFQISKINIYDKIILEETVYEEFNKVNSDIYCFSLLKNNPEKILHAKKEKKFVKIDSLTIIKFRLIPTTANSQIFLTIKDIDKEYKYDNSDLMNPLTPLLGRLYSADNIKEVNYALNTILGHFKNISDNIKQRYVKLHKENKYVSYIDFLFYSASNLSLLKYDKISSEQTLINLINFFQAIFGIFYLAYGILIIWPDTKE